MGCFLMSVTQLLTAYNQELPSIELLARYFCWLSVLVYPSGFILPWGNTAPTLSFLPAAGFRVDSALLGQSHGPRKVDHH